MGGAVLDVEHVVLGLIADDVAVLRDGFVAGWTMQRVQGELVGTIVASEKVLDGPVDLGRRLDQVLLRAAAEADSLGSIDIDVEHIVLAVLESEGLGGETLRAAGLTRAKVLHGISQR